MPEMKSLTLNDKTYDSFVDPVARALAFDLEGRFEEITASIGDIDAALDELHAYAQNLIAGGDA